MNISLDMYRDMLTSSGHTVAELKRNQTAMIINQTFTQDHGYKKVYILSPGEGWKFEDAKYQQHVAQSISKDTVDFWLQFRPKVHYPVGTYVLVPNDTSPKLNLEGEEWDNPVLQPIPSRTMWWLIVDRTNALDYVRYSILPCNWNFRWVYNGQVQECFGVMRSANSYTS